MAYACTNTEIQNVTSSPMVLSMFGKTVQGGGTFTVPGDVWAYVVAKHPGIKGRRMVTHLAFLIDNDYLRINYYPRENCGATQYPGSSSSSHS